MTTLKPFFGESEVVLTEQDGGTSVVIIGSTGSGSSGVSEGTANTVRSGAGVPSNTLGSNGDFYIDTANSNIYGPKALGSWGSATSLVGPQGDKGDQGDDGEQGPSGVSSLSYTVIEKTDDHIFELTDAQDNTLVSFNKGSAIIGTVPPNADVAFPTGSVIFLAQTGAGQLTIAAGSGVTILTPESLLAKKQNARLELVKINTNIWLLSGDMKYADGEELILD